MPTNKEMDKLNKRVLGELRRRWDDEEKNWSLRRKILERVCDGVPIKVLNTLQAGALKGYMNLHKQLIQE